MVILSIGSLSAQEGYVSNNNYTGSWNDVSTWNKSAHWLADQPGVLVNGSTSYLDLYGFVTSSGDIQLAGSADVTVYDTLLIYGNLTVTGGASITVESTGVLMIDGDLNANGGTITTNQGRSVVTGDITIAGGADLDNNPTPGNGFYLFGSASRSGGAKFNGSNNPTASNFLGQADFNTNEPGLASLMSPLPIELLSFQGRSTQSRIVLDWSTASEENFDYFSIERSQDARSFEAIGTVSGVGNSETIINYSFDDTNPLAGRSYYRLKAVDLDGTFEYSQIILVDFSGFANAFAMYPNPNNGQHLTIQLGHNGEIDGVVSVFKMDGQKIISQRVNSAQTTISFNEALERGRYLVQVVYADQVINQKLMVQ